MSAAIDDDDDEAEIGDHGTVVMPRNMVVPPSKSRGAPPAPPPPPGYGPPSTPLATTNAQGMTRGGMPAAQASPALPTLPSSVTGLGSAPPPPLKNATPPAKLVPLVLIGSFFVVFVLGALVMILIRLTRPPAAEEAPAAKPSASAVSAAKAPAPIVAPVQEPAATGETKVIKPPDPPSTSKGSATPSTATKNKAHTISDDL